MNEQYVFLGGAPKCGTSGLFNLLKETNLFTPSVPKETFYFIDKDYPLYRKSQNIFTQGFEGFRQFFPGAKEHNIFLEGTTHLLYQRQVADKVAEIDSKVIFVLRDPADRIRSSFEYTVNNLANFKKPISFHEYVDILLSGDTTALSSYMYDNTASHRILAQELKLSNYKPYLDYWRKTLGDERVIVLAYERLKNSPVNFLKELINQLELELPVDFDINNLNRQKNSTRYIRNKKLHKMMGIVNRNIPGGVLKKKIKEWYFKAQQKEREWTEKDQEALEKLKEYYERNCLPLNELININLTKNHKLR